MFHRFYIDTNYKYTVSYIVKGRNLLAQFYNGLRKRQFLKNLKSIHIPGKIRLPLRKIWTKFYIKYGYDHITSIIKVITICRVVYVTLPKQNQPIIRKISLIGHPTTLEQKRFQISGIAYGYFFKFNSTPFN